MRVRCYQLLKILLHRFAIVMAYGLYFMQGKYGRGTKKIRAAFVTIEMFHKELNGGGGYGITVKNVSHYFNSKKNRLGFDVLLTKSDKSACRTEQYGCTDVTFSFKERSKILINTLDHLRHIKFLSKKNLDVLVAIEYYPAYESFLTALPSVPLLIWLRDSRTLSDWKKIATVAIGKECSAINENELQERVLKTRRSLQRIMKLSRILKRKIIFMSQADFLLPKAELLYGRFASAPCYLPNPIEFPEQIAIKTKRPSVVFLGRLEPVKRPWIFCEIAKQFPNINFEIAGTTRCPNIINPIMSQYQNIPNLRFLGVVEGKQKDQLLQSSWVMINTSIHEALPVSFEEAFAASTYVISCQNPDNLIERFGTYTGELMGNGFDDTTVTIFSNALEKALENQRQRKHKVRLAKEYVHKVHSYENFQKNFNKILDILKN